ncbi:MAG: histidine kinase [Pseudomonadota bacterium]|nr:histidine kinase [Pseudomonadota bacterium]
MTHGPLQRWVRQAACEFGRRDVLIAVALALFFLIFANGGGYLLASLTEHTNPIFDPAKTYAKTFFTWLLGRTLPLVFAIRTAEAAITDGARPWCAYLAALLAALVCSQAINYVPIGRINRSTEHVGQFYWFLLSVGIQFGTAIVVYALWRASQRTTQRVRASEAARAQDLQRLQSAELLALQARVEPQLLLDTLGRVGLLQRSDPHAAQRLLTNLIEMLRAILPGRTAVGSTVEREFEVIRLWLQVMRGLGHALPSVEVGYCKRLAQATLAPMLALPMLRSVLAAEAVAPVAWRLGAEAAAGRLMVTLSTDAQPEDTVALDHLDLGSVRDNLARLHGAEARLWITSKPRRLVLDLPLAEAFLADPGAGVEP